MSVLAFLAGIALAIAFAAWRPEWFDRLIMRWLPDAWIAVREFFIAAAIWLRNKLRQRDVPDDTDDAGA